VLLVMMNDCSENPDFSADELRDLYAMYCAVLRHPGRNGNGWCWMDYPEFVKWWTNLSVRCRLQEGEVLRLEYRHVLQSSVVSGLKVIKKFMTPESPPRAGKK